MTSTIRRKTASHDLFATYQDTYMQVRHNHGHPGEPILYRDWVYLETIKPPGWTAAQYDAYFADVQRVQHWYFAARDYARDAAKRGDHGEARQAYLQRAESTFANSGDVMFGEPCAEALF